MVTTFKTEQFCFVQNVFNKSLGIDNFDSFHFFELQRYTIVLIIQEFIEKTIKVKHNQIGTVFSMSDGEGNFGLRNMQSIGAHFSVKPKMSRGLFTPIVRVLKSKHRYYLVLLIFKFK